MNLWNDYKKIPLPKVLSFIVDNRGKTVPTAKDGNHKLIATNCIRNENLYPSYEKIRLLSEDTYQTWFRAHPIPGDIIFVCKGTPGRTCMVPDPIDFCIAQDMIAFRVDEKQIYNRYLLVVLRSREIQEQIANTSVGDVIPHFKKQFLDQLLIPLPPMDIQKKIGDLYFAMALKEELNKRINKNLEQQAQSIYEEFLSNHQTFPVTIGDIVLMANTGADAIQKAPIVDYDTGIRCVRVGDLSNQRPVYEWGFTKVTPEIFKRYQLHKDDIVVTRTASLGLNQLIGEDLNAVYNNGLIRISINDDIVYPLIVYRQFQTKDYRNYISRITGETSVRPNMKINYLLKYKFEILEKAEQTELVHIIQPLFEAQERNTSENLLLSSLRDALLPKLMSGELDVSNLDL